MRKTDEAFENRYYIKFSDLDDKKTLRPSRLVDYLQDISMTHSSYGGYDVGYFKENKACWIIYHWHLHIYDLPEEEGTPLDVSTWCKQFKRTQANREITVESPEGKLYCYASVRFVLTDTETRRPKPFTEEWFVPYTFKKERSYKDEDFKLPSTPEHDPDDTRVLEVMRSDADSNGHANNAVYIDWAVNGVPDEIYDNCKLKDLRITYKKECLKGAMVRCDEYVNDISEPPADRPELAGGKQIITVFSSAEDPKKILSKVSMIWK